MHAKLAKRLLSVAKRLQKTANKEPSFMVPVRNVAKHILQKWGNKRRWLLKAVDAANKAGMEQPQDIFPPNFLPHEEAYMALTWLLVKEKFPEAPAIDEGGMSREFYEWLDSQLSVYKRREP
jgi:hypothetical protein